MSLHASTHIHAPFPYVTPTIKLITQYWVIIKFDIQIVSNFYNLE